MRRWIWSSLLLTAAGCSRGPALPEQPSEDPSARTTTAYNPPSTPQELAAQCDVPIYPGAKAPDDMSRMPRHDNDGVHYELVLTTKDPVGKVADFYSKQLKLPVDKLQTTPSIVGETPKGNDLILTFNTELGQTVIRIKSIAKAH